MKLTIFAATGGIGRHVLDQAHAAGHDITAVVRDPAKATTLTARIAAPAYRRPISLLGPVRPFPIDERKKPAGNRTAATGTPLQARVSWTPLTLAESARIWQISAASTSTPAWGVPGPRERLLEGRHRDSSADDPKRERPSVFDRDDREEQDARGRSGVLGEDQFPHRPRLRPAWIEALPVSRP
jgi:hypothetical protein